ncbi:hypothetical protein EsCd1HHP049_05465 (plasmid) [Escherichia sp. HH154_1D]|nr:hypothetical protein EsCd1HHP049_05465 [Escherichia sp. HH154_1D]
MSKKHPFRDVFLIFLGFKFLSMNKKSIKPLLNMILIVKNPDDQSINIYNTIKII